MNFIIRPFLLIVFNFMVFISVFAAKSDLETVRQRFVTELLAPGVNESHIAKLIETIETDGSWADIDYEDVSNTGFRHGKHLANMVEMSRAYKKNGSPYKGDKQLKKAIYSALDFWLAHDFICENWWWNQIGTPRLLVSVLLIMDHELTKEQVAKTIPMVGRANLNASGARPSGDRIKIAGILAKSLLFQRNESSFNEVVRVIEGEIKFATGRGMQYDYSFHHRHDNVNNTLSYGTGYADAFAEWAANVAGTQYQFSEEPMKQLIDYYLDGICKMMVFGKYPDPGATNRDITRRGSLNAWGPRTPENLLLASNYRENELEEIVKIRKGEAIPTFSHSTFYWNTEHFTFQRPDFFTSVRMFSTRNHNMEEPYNSEGLMNHHRGDGTNYISRTGDEYKDLAPVYDWQKIPGATVMQKESLPSEKEIQKKGLTDFVGALTDGKYGVAAFDFKSPHDPLEAKKAWFFFDKEYVCLGAGINSQSVLPVATTLNQCLLRGDVTVMSAKEKSLLQTGEHQPEQVKWVWHDSIGYLFPEPQKIELANQAQTGSWYKVNRQTDSPKEEISNNIFKLWIDHGSRVENGSYSYIVIPAVAEDEMDQFEDSHDIEILSNTPDLQAVKNIKLNIYQLVFYKSSKIELSNNLRLVMDSPGLIMIKDSPQKITGITVSDPSRKLGKIHFSISEKIEENGENYTAIWNVKDGLTDISVELPQGVYAGKSVTIKF